jgi:hypothetical protein
MLTGTQLIILPHMIPMIVLDTSCPPHTAAATPIQLLKGCHVVLLVAGPTISLSQTNEIAGAVCMDNHALKP